jgi:hypothetical protein
MHFLVTIVVAFCAYPEARAGGSPPPKEKLRYDSKPFEYWRNYLQTELKPARRLDGIRAMAVFGTRGYASEAAAAITELMKEDFGEEAYRWQEKLSDANRLIAEAASAVIAIGAPAFDVLAKNVGSKNIRTFFTYAVGALADNADIPFSDPVTHDLIRTALGADADLRKFAVEVLARGMWTNKHFKENTVTKIAERKRAHQFVRAIVASLDKSNSYELQNVLSALGPRAKGAIPTLVKIKLKDWYLHCDLAELGADSAILVPLIVESLNADDSQVKVHACNWLGELGSNAATAVPALAQLLKGEDPDIRLAAMKTFGLIGPRAKSAVSVLIAIATDEEETSATRAAAIQAVEKIGVEAQEILPLLIKIVDDEMKDNPTSGQIYNELSSCALLFLVKIDAAPKQTVPLLTRALKQYANSHFSRSIAEALGKMGPAAAEALPVLRQLAESRDRQLRRAAGKAIEKITGK